jgi:hypothetical protein
MIIKRSLIIFVAIFTVIFTQFTVSGSDTIHVYYDGRLLPFDSDPVINQNRTLVPMRSIFEEFGASVLYDSASKKITAIKHSGIEGIRYIYMTIGENKAVISNNGIRKEYILDAAPIISEGRTMLPLRFVSEALGAQICWNSEDRTVLYDQLTVKEQELASKINEYRVSRGHQPLKISRSLTIVARYHVLDSNANQPEKNYDPRGIKGNLHSWSDCGHWLPVTYTSDHSYKELMWSKPSELTVYDGSGFEISAFTSYPISTDDALRLFTGSYLHNQVLLGEGYWESMTSMGIAISGHYCHIWFGAKPDPAGYHKYSITANSILVSSQ